MRSTEGLEQNRRIAAKKHPPAPPDDEMEDELAFAPFAPLDTAVSIYDRGCGKRFGGINTAPSVFDRKALFHSKPED